MPYMYSNRPSRLRQGPSVRALVRETVLKTDDLVMPLFFKEGKGTSAIASMPGIKKMPQDALLREVEALSKIGIKAVLLFGAASRRDSIGSSSYDEKSLFHDAIRAIKRSSDMILITDVCLCAYTDHGHCGIIKTGTANSGQRTAGHGHIDNARTIEVLARIALSHAQAGADWVAPSAMADGQVRAIRGILDANGFIEKPILSYAVKYASGFYGPFRDIYDSSPAFGDRRSYQMDPGNKREALREALLDVEEGADMVMIKPALSYLDIISAVKEKVNVPVAAYNVSGEYAMVKAAAEKGVLDERSCAMEILGSIKRAGADIIITYWAKEAARWI